MFEIFKRRSDEGITAKDVVPEIATPQEPVRAEGERFGRIKAGIEKIMEDGPGFSVQDMLGRQDFFAEKLVENKILSPQDIGFPGIMNEIVEAAREVSKGGVESVGRDPNWKKEKSA